MSKGATTHDVSFKVGSTEYGFQLAESKPGVKMIGRRIRQLYDVNYPNEKPSYDNIPPTKEINIVQTDFSGGVGQENFNNNRRFLKATGVETTIPNRVYAMPFYTVHSEKTKEVANGGFETASPLQWYVSGSSVSLNRVDSATIYPNEGDFSGWLHTSVGSQTISAYQDIAASSADVGFTIVASAVLAVDSGIANAYLSISDGVNEATSDIVAGTTLTLPNVTWAPVSARLTINNPSVTNIRISIVAQTVAGSPLYYGNVYIDSVRFNEPSCFVIHGTTLYHARGAVLESWNGSTWVTANTLKHAITDLASYSGGLYTAHGGNYKVTADGIETSLYADFLGVCGTELIYGKKPNEVRRSSATGTIITVGDNNSNITDIPDHLDPIYIYICKENAVYAIDPSNNVSTYLDLRHDTGEDTGKNSVYWHNQLFVPSANYNLYRITTDDNVVSSIGLSRQAPTVGAYKLNIQALGSDSDFLIGMAFDSTNKILHVIKGRYANIGGEYDFYWHDVANITLPSDTTAIRDCCVYTNNGIRKLFFNTNLTTGFVSLPIAYNDLTLDTSHTYKTNVTSAGLYTSGIDAGYRDKVKAWYTLMVQHDNCSANSNIIVKYGMDAAGDSNTATTITTSGLTTTQYAFPPGTTGKVAYLSFFITTADANKTPVLLGYRLTGQLIDDKRYDYQITIKLAENQGLITGAREINTVATQIHNIETIVNQTFPVLFTDPDGNQKYVTTQIIDDKWVWIEHLRQAERWVTLSLQEANWQ